MLLHGICQQYRAFGKLQGQVGTEHEGADGVGARRNPHTASRGTGMDGRLNRSRIIVNTVPYRAVFPHIDAGGLAQGMDRNGHIPHPDSIARIRSQVKQRKHIGAHTRKGQCAVDIHIVGGFRVIGSGILQLKTGGDRRNIQTVKLHTAVLSL